MKKHYPLLLVFLVAVSSLFVSCGENEWFEEINKCRITVVATDGGEVKISKYLQTSELILLGREIEVVATPDEGYIFTGWYLDDSTEPISNDAVFTFVATKNTTLTAHFTKLSNLAICSSGNGSVSFKDYVGASVAVLSGNDVTVIATPNADCDFIGWFVGDGDIPVSTDAEYTFTVKENITLTAKFSKRPVVAVRSAGYGSVSFKDSADASVAVLSGSEVTVVATPDEDCDFIGWFIGDEDTPVSTDAEYTFAAKENITLTAKFSKRPVVAVRSAGNGSVSFKDYVGASVVVLSGNEVTVVATPDADCDFIGWFVGDGDIPVSTDAEYTFIVKENITLTAKFKFRTNPSGHEYVDLGLSVKWATCNVGATKPEEYGGYYAWGETEDKNNYEWSTYKWCNGSYDTQTKYCTDSYYGTVDNKIVLDPKDDVAHVKWGGSWRMPTLDELNELLNNCNWEWTTQNGVNGYTVTGPNGNCIFIPAAGSRNGTGVKYRGSRGYYWSSSLYSSYSYYAYDLFFDSGDFDWSSGGYRYGGRSVRPVCD